MVRRPHGVCLLVVRVMVCHSLCFLFLVCQLPILLRSTIVSGPRWLLLLNLFRLFCLARCLHWLVIREELLWTFSQWERKAEALR